MDSEISNECKKSDLSGSVSHFHDKSHFEFRHFPIIFAIHLNQHMSTSDIKANLHLLLDKIENEHLLRILYDFIKQRESTQEGQFWNTLTEDQKNEIYLSYESSQDVSKLINWNSVKKNY